MVDVPASSASLLCDRTNLLSEWILTKSWRRELTCEVELVSTLVFSVMVVRYVICDMSIVMSRACVGCGSSNMAAPSPLF